MQVTKEPIGYQNPDGDLSQVEPVLELTQEQAIKRLHRVMLENNIQALRSAEAELAAMKTACKHEVFNDTEGYPYNFRTCYICGVGMGIL